MKRILVTGGTGFVGQRLVSKLYLENKYEVSLAARSIQKLNSQNPKKDLRVFIHDNITWDVDFQPILETQDVVVHTAGRAHVMKEREDDPLSAYRMVNVYGTLAVAKQAIEAGVKRFIYLSTSKVNNGLSEGKSSISELDVTDPVDPYSISKLEAEQGLWELTKNSDMEVVIIRPPLIYGPGVKGNFEQLIKIVLLGVPLPFGSIKNSRSFLALDNLVDFIETCCEHPSAGNNLFLVSDDDDISTPELIDRVALAFDVPCRNFPIPENFLACVFSILGKRTISDRIMENQKLDITKAKKMLSWKPKVTMHQQLTLIAKNRDI